MTIRRFALIFGLVFLLVGIAGFVPPLMTAVHLDHPGLAVGSGYDLLLGLFPVNLAHNVVHLAFGVWGLIAYRSLGAAKLYARGVAIVYAVLTVAGVVPTFDTLFGLTPLFGNNIWLHALLAIAAGYFGWMHPEAQPAPQY